ncbi:GNAT family N-acetyltransferase [Flagellimonas allohymeniacidonis]|uniref:GNAT family N-acetyltransferase n=1 Tax=Flagellimonas allohymeniacidonis TaxID=2517819 RepID=A0A4Q8QBL8_9FLAO|nr:GNAT family N-acetyltransferase [Allomuricauda hymeniacidonis]TAI46787.1 GNAT family N-acetyltransferase [Allomuricauda hymeniacidonis]
MKTFKGSVRKATIADLEVLLNFEQEIIKAERPFDPTIDKDPVHYYDLAKMLGDENAHVVVAEEEGKIIASGYAIAKRARHYLDHEYYAYLGFMYTHPDFRGMGVNAMIVEELKNWSEKKGLTEIRLTVYDDNTPAIKAYEKVGFKKHIIEMRLDS